MPTYEYECTKCDHVFERFHSMTAAPVKRCPKCRCKVRKLFGTGAGIIFKGSGFYPTDYRSNGYERDAKKASDSVKADKTASDAKASSSTKESSSSTKKKEKKSPAGKQTAA